ncbi:MAG: hypothetical protein LBL90_00565 [Prevotellaceae bacterium]|jgi:phosphatidylserine synthase|nr:hypothetical protein [Prevotellaceae bacterium]
MKREKINRLIEKAIFYFALMSLLQGCTEASETTVKYGFIAILSVIIIFVIYKMVDDIRIRSASGMTLIFSVLTLIVCIILGIVSLMTGKMAGLLWKTR